MSRAAAWCAVLACAGGVPPAVAENASPAARTVHLGIERVGPGRLPWTVFDEKSGLPQNTIVDLVRDPDGSIWAATQDGLARYNGRTWQVVPLPPQMHSNYPRALRISRDGGLWVGTFDGGLAHLKDDAWSVIDTAAGLPSNRIRGLYETNGEGGAVLWIATDKGAARLDRGRITVFDARSGLPSDDTEGLGEITQPDGSKQLLVGTAAGLARLDHDRFVPVGVPKQLLGHRIGNIVESAGLGGGRALWIDSYGGGMGVLEDDQWTVLDAASGLPSNVEVITASRSDDGSPALWIGAEGGLLRFEKGRFRLYTTAASGLPSDTIWKVLETEEPGGQRLLWLGTWGVGVVRLSAKGWTAFDAGMGMPMAAVTSVLATTSDDGDEVTWAGTSEGSLVRLDRSGLTTMELPAALHHSLVFSLLETREKDGTRSLWLASFGGGLGRLNRGGWTVYDPKALPNERVYSVRHTTAADGSDEIWAATEGGLGRLDQKGWTFFHKGELPSDIVTQLVQTVRRDGTRSIWASTSEGIGRFEANRWTIVDTRSGLPSNNVVEIGVTRDADGTQWLWATTQGGGAARLRVDDPSGRWETFSTRTLPGLPSDTIPGGVKQDRAGRIYLFTTQGVARLTPRQPTPDDPAPFSVYTFGVEDGLPSGDCQQGASFSDARGRIWVGTARGLALYDPNSEIPDRAPKPLRIERAALLDRTRELAEGTVLSHVQRNIAFDYALLSYRAESRTRYRVQLVGFDPEPSEWTSSPRKEYTNLGAGAYAFRVWGRDAVGNVSGPVSRSFLIRPAPWRTSWAYAAYALATVGSAYGALRLRLRAMARRTEQLESMVAGRTVELQESERRAHEANQAKSTFLASMSHELRTPLTGVLGFAQLMERRKGRDPEDVRHLGIIQRSGEHLLNLVNGVLSLAKIEAGGVDLEESVFDPAVLAARAEEMVRVRAEAKGLALTSELGPDLPAAVCGDLGKLRQILVNLLGNAVKFTDSGSVTLRVAWSDGRGSFEVSDTGQGIAAPEMARLFQPFVQTETGRRSTEGTGLGLALSRRLAQLMGGDITAESEPGRGSTFRLSVALPEATATALTARTHEGRRVAALAPGQRAFRVLVVDDVADNRALLTGLLTSVGYDVRQATNGAEALDAYHEWHPDLIWMDNRMPVMDGPEAVRRIRDETTRIGAPAVRIIIHSASALEHERREILAGGCDDFVAKPFDEATVFARTAEHLGARYVYDAPIATAAARPARVLVADDDPISLELASNLLAGFGLSVTEVESGEQVLARLATERFDALLLDGEMPGMDGFATARAIRARLDLSRLPIVAMSAHADPGDQAAFLAAGMSAHVAKPLERDRLRAVLEKWLPLASRDAGSGETLTRLPPLAGVDVAAGVRRAGGNSELFRRVLSDFLRGIESSRSQLEDLLARDPAAALRLLHTLKGTGASVGAERLSQAAAAVESAVRGGNAQLSLSDLGAALEELRGAAAALRPASTEAPAAVGPPVSATVAQRALPIAGRLAERLADSDLAALDAFAELKALLGPGSVRELETCLDTLDFDGAASRLSVLRQTLEASARAAAS